MIKNTQDYQSILIVIMVQKNPIETRVNFSLGGGTIEIPNHIRNVIPS